jgi:hypothetical protein
VCGAHGEKRNARRMSVWSAWGEEKCKEDECVERMGRREMHIGKAEGNGSLRRLRCRQGNNVKKDPRGIRCGDMDCIHVAQVRDQCMALVKTVMNLRVP